MVSMTVSSTLPTASKEAAMGRTERSSGGRSEFAQAPSLEGIELARAINERIRELSGNWGESEYDFVCECTDAGCYRSIRMTGRDYDTVRTQASWRIVLPGHHHEADEIISYSAQR